MTGGARAIPAQPGGTWDDRRNTSQVRQPAPDALPLALAALRRFRQAEPAHAAWIEQGYPPLTRDDHRARFGCDYVKPKAKR